MSFLKTTVNRLPDRAHERVTQARWKGPFNGSPAA
jgi:hypothetical protein